MYLFCTFYVTTGFRHTIGILTILILYLTENLEIFNVPYVCLFRLGIFHCACHVPIKT